jgi:hypothetical protein
MPAMVIFILSLAALVLSVIGLTHLSVWLGRREIKNEEEQERRRHHEKQARSSQNYQTSGEAISSRLEAIIDQFYARGKEDGYHERTRTLLEVAGVSAATIAAILAFWSAWIFQGQLIEMRAGNRPWIKDTAIVIDKLEVQKNQVSIWLKVTYKNIGHSPAEQVTIIPEMLIPGLQPWDFLEVKALCADLKTHPKLLMGNILFPDDSIESHSINFGRSMRDIEQGRDNQVNLSYTGWAMSFGKKAADAFRPDLLKMANKMTFSIVGCIAYTFIGSRDVHATSFAFGLSRSGLTKYTDGTTGDGFDITQPGVIDSKDLKLTPSMWGRYAD